VDQSGVTALMYAADRGKAHFVKVLLAKGADVNAKDASGGTALRAARDAKHTEVEAILKAAGAKQ
jgi:ankyrin repeat protein